LTDQTTWSKLIKIIGVLAGISCLRNEESFSPALKWLLGILAGGTIACFIGLADDIFDIKPWQKILGQVAAAVILLLVGITPNLHLIAAKFNLPMPHNLEMILGVFIVIFFVLGATNSLNLLDGLDGLCAGVTVIITIVMLVLAIHLATWGTSEVGDPVRIIICLGLVGGVCGFLPFNRYPAKIFMGDAGSMLLGFMVAALMINSAMVDGFDRRLWPAHSRYRCGTGTEIAKSQALVCFRSRPYL
jgi:UDP-GlcNAc:undecaprenyl-phosphate GlcNAc-1-phosphate transferase